MKENIKIAKELVKVAKQLVIAGNVANKEGIYKYFTGKIDWKGTTGNVSGAIFELNSKGIIWYSGTWFNGTWSNGTWKDGQWHNGTWKNGNWYRGTVNGETTEVHP